MTESAKTAVILTALYDETHAVLRHLGNVTTETVSGTGFHRGQFEGREVAVVEAGPGNASAAVIAVRALGHYKPDVALFVGVAGGVKDVAIGDVVVGTKVYGYESGKDTAGGFKTRADLMNTAHDLEQRARLLRQSEHWKKRLDPAIRDQNPRVFVDPIAAGEKVVASDYSATAMFLREHYGDALAVEMEGRGFLEGVHVCHPVRGCIVRGISDLLSGKAAADKAGSQRVAADAASAVAFEMLTKVGGDVDSTIPKKNVMFIGQLAERNEIQTASSVIAEEEGRQREIDGLMRGDIKRSDARRDVQHSPVRFRAWFQRNCKWFSPLPISAGVVVAVLSENRLANSDISTLSIADAKSADAVTQRLGEPVKLGWITWGSLSHGYQDHEGDHEGHANLRIPLSGPRGQGTLYVVANANYLGNWTYQSLQLKLQGDATGIDLLQSRPTAVDSGASLGSLSGWALSDQCVTLRTRNGRNWFPSPNTCVHSID
jgi:5'-methylthioadenosine/S-adenosylhomocysteine nucleosidase